MSGIEVIGLLASASQLALYSLKITTSISEIYRQIQEAPKKIRQHAEQLDQLLKTAKLIQFHPSLQTVAVDDQIKTTMKQAIKLASLLERVRADYSRGSVRKYWKILRGRHNKEILDSFEALEKEKSALQLCIAVVNTDLLRSIQDDINLPIAKSVFATSKPQRKPSQRSLKVSRIYQQPYLRSSFRIDCQQPLCERKFFKAQGLY